MYDDVPDAAGLRKLYDTQQYHDIWFGACRLALSLQELIKSIQNDRKLNNTRFLNNILEFLLMDKSDMMTYIMNDNSIIFRLAPERDKKGKVTGWKPYAMLHDDGVTPEYAGTEFISEKEYKWRDTARIFLKALNEACVTLSMLTGRDQDEIFNQLLKGQPITEPEGEAVESAPLITESPVGSVKISKSDIPRGVVEKPFICMDFFSGAATTAHAVMQLNAEDGGKRRFIMVQSPEPCKENTAAYKAGYSTIADIGKERIRRAAKKIAEENPGKEFDGGFQVWKTEDAPPLAGNVKHPEVPAAPLTGRDIARVILEHFGLPADVATEEIEVLGGRFWSVDNGRLIFSDEPGVTVEQARAICGLKPESIALTKACSDVVAEVQKYLDVHEQMKV